MTVVPGGNILFQSEKHPLVAEQFLSFEDYCLSLIHEKAYEVGAALALGKTVLDVGCNSGYGTARLGKSARHAVGVDVSPHSVEAANGRYGGANVEFKLVDGGRLPFEDCAFDCVFSFQVIEHVEDRHAYLAELKRVLKADGLAVLTTPNRAIRLDPGMKPWNPFHVTEFSAVELRGELASHFAHIQIQGLFAVDEIYETELRRAHKARAKARSRVRRIAKLAVRQLFTQQAAARIHRLSRALARSPQAPAVAGLLLPTRQGAVTREYSTRDLFYQTDGLDEALDLLALCCVDEEPLSDCAHHLL